MYFLQEYLPKFWNSDFYRAGPLGHARQPVSWSGGEEGGVVGAGGRGGEEERRGSGGGKETAVGKLLAMVRKHTCIRVSWEAILSKMPTG